MILRKTLLAAAAVAPLALGMVPAHAGQNVVQVSGTGTIDPGLPCPPAGCNIHLDFAASFAGQDASGNASCTFDGTDTVAGGATLAQGSGSGTIDCTGGATAHGTVSFIRVGAAVSVTGSITVNGHTCAVTVGLVFSTTQTPPITSFRVDGGGNINCA